VTRMARDIYREHGIEYSSYYEKEGVISERLTCQCHATFIGERQGEASRLYGDHLVQMRLDQLEIWVEQRNVKYAQEVVAQDA
jgi:hypothetical protein